MAVGPDQQFRVVGEEEPTDLSVDMFRLRVLRDTESRADKLDRLAGRIQAGIVLQPSDMVDAIHILAQQLRHHRALLSMEIAANQRKSAQDAMTWWRRFARWARGV